MEDLFKSVSFHTDNGETILELGYIPLEKTWVEGKDLLKRFKKGCLLERKHEFLQTQIILNEVDCLLLLFDEELGFISYKPVSRSKAPFSLFISEPFIILLPSDSELREKAIEYIDFDYSDEEFDEDYSEQDEFPEIFVVTLDEETLKRMEETAIPFTTEEEEEEAAEAAALNVMKQLKK